MVSAGMKSLTGDAGDRDAWRRFISPQDVVGIKVNCSGAPRICSAPELVGAIVENLTAIGVPAKQDLSYTSASATRSKPFPTRSSFPPA